MSVQPVGTGEAGPSSPRLPPHPLAIPTILRQDSLTELVVAPATCRLHPGIMSTAGAIRGEMEGGLVQGNRAEE